MKEIKPLFTKEKPMPFNEALEFMASKTESRKIDIHKDDGTPCTLPYCTKKHDTYSVTYQRISVVKNYE